MMTTKEIIFYAIASQIFLHKCIAEESSSTSTSENGVTKTTETKNGVVTKDETTSRPKLTLFYESLSPECRTFIKDVFMINYEGFIGSIEFDLVPFGFGEMKLVPGKLNITSEHGEEGLLGNKYQACALRKETDDAKKLKYCVCVMTTDGEEAYKSCAEGMDFTALDTCAKGDEGFKYLREFAATTMEKDPAILFIPVMYINDKELTNEDQKNFKTFLCQMWVGENVPTCCSPPSPPPLP